VVIHFTSPSQRSGEGNASKRKGSGLILVCFLLSGVVYLGWRVYFNPDQEEGGTQLVQDQILRVEDGGGSQGGHSKQGKGGGPIGGAKSSAETGRWRR